MEKEDEEPLYSDDENESDNDSDNESKTSSAIESEDDDDETGAAIEQDEDVGVAADDDEEDNDADDDDEDDDDENAVELPEQSSNKNKNKKITKIEKTEEDGDDDEDDDEDYQNPYLQKFDAEINKNYLLDFHPECTFNNYDEISLLTQVVRDNANNIIDDLHKTIPFLTKYERTRVIGQRAKQINSGAKTFVKVPENIIDGYLIAEMELMQKRIPFIIRRPTPSGGCEYWNLNDLEIISF